ncbi:heavy metal-associated domain-containing protein [Parabacteroides sp. PF5-9]|uniref:heavy-metal-associated domain-containing protein n=1 Tax=Parabacteroides sp. PF5-9 TaxID=1742404 RepID=UPI00247D6787|nr:copper chaperone [Parabacteroides sp. PF5-9]
MMQFKTNAKCGGCEAAIRLKLDGIVQACDWSLDLDSPDKLLTINTDISPSVIIEAVQSAGFQIEQIQ